MLVFERLEQWPDLLPRCIGLFLGLNPDLQAKMLTSPEARNALVNLARQGRNGPDRDLRALHDRLLAIGALGGGWV